MVCLETSFLVDVLRGNKDCEALLDSFSDEVYLVSPSLMEVVSGAELGSDPLEERQKIRELVTSFPVLDLDADSALLAGELEAYLVLSGQIVPPVDIMIGAIAKQHGEAIVTRNTKHFERIPGLEVRGY